MDLNSVNITATQVAKNYFSAYVENGFIYSYSVYGERQQVGVTNDAYTALQKTAQEALDKAEKYYQRLVELGDNGARNVLMRLLGLSASLKTSGIFTMLLICTTAITTQLSVKILQWRRNSLKRSLRM